MYASVAHTWVVALPALRGRRNPAPSLTGQEDQLVTIARLNGKLVLPAERVTTAEAGLYQVALAAVARLVDFDFGTLGAADGGTVERFGGGPRGIAVIAKRRLWGVRARSDIVAHVR